MVAEPGHSIDPADPSHEWYESADLTVLATNIRYRVFGCKGCSQQKWVVHE